VTAPIYHSNQAIIRYHHDREPLLREFHVGEAYTGLARAIAEKFADVAFDVAVTMKAGPSRTEALRKLLDVRNAAIATTYR